MSKKNKRNKFFNSGVLFFALAFVFFFSLPAQAEVKIDATFEDDPLFDVSNAAPGQTFTKEATVKNSGDQDQDLYLNIESTTNQDFANVIKFYVKDKNSGKYYIGGSGDRFTLKKANNDGDLFVERLADGNSNTYQIKLALGTSVGNEYQNNSSKFDIVFGFTGQPAATGTPLPLRPGQTAGGNPGPEEVAGVTTTSEPVITEEGTLGAETQCSEWPLWVWIILLVIYAVLFNYSSFRQSLENKIHWFFPALWTSAIFAIWYFFEKCRLYPWYPYAIVIIALISYFSYLYWFRQKKLEPDFKDKEEL